MTVTKRFFEDGEQIGGSKLYFTRDHLGSVREVTSITGGVLARYEYDPYGRRTKVYGSPSTEADFGFTGYYYHADTGLHLALYRAYDADIGRWLNRDPIGEEGGLNLYGYVEGDPMNSVDPLGDTMFGRMGKNGVRKFIRSKTARFLLQKGKGIFVTGGRRTVEREIEKTFPGKKALYHDRDSTAREFGGPHGQPSPRPKGEPCHLFDADRMTKSNWEQLRDAAQYLSAAFWAEAITGSDDSSISQDIRNFAADVDEINPLTLPLDMIEIVDTIGKELDGDVPAPQK